MFGTFLILAATLMQAYVFWRASTVPWVRRHIPLWGLVGAGAALWALLLAGRFAGHGASGPWAAALELAGMDQLASLFIAFTCVLVLDLLTLFGLLFRRHAPRWRGWALLAAAAFSAIAVVQGMRPPVVDAYEVRLPGLPPALDGTVVVALSDLHLGNVLGADWLAERVAQVQGERPDLVLLLGDLFEGHGGAPVGDLLAVLGTLSAPLGVWAVPGNHEDGHGGGGNGGVPVESAGITVLRDRWVQAAPGLVLAGVADGEKEGSFARALAGRPPGGVLLLSHSPHKADAAAAASDGGLMLSGHTHGGQVWPFGYLVRFRSPWVEGRFRVGGMDLIVTRGAGTWGPRMRLWLPGEILRITLRASSSV